MTQHRTKTDANRARKEEERWCYFMLIIPIVGFAVFSVYPILWTFKWSFYNYTGAASSAVFIGLKNFSAVFQDRIYWSTWLTTLEFTLLKVPLEMCLALVLAIILMKGLKGSGFFRIVFYMPNVISVAVIGVIFTNMFGYYGVINTLLRQNADWFSTKLTAIVMLVLVSIWNTFGVNVMYLMSALANVPTELYECASLDGASAWVKFKDVTLPMIRPVFGVVLLLAVLGTLSTNEYILAFTGGAPNGATNTVMSYLTTQYVPGFVNTTGTDGVVKLGYGSALSLVTTILFIFVGIIHQKIGNRSNT